MKSYVVATIKSKSPYQQKHFEVRQREDMKYELNLVWPSTYNFGVFDTPGDCRKKAESVTVGGVKVNVRHDIIRLMNK